MSGWVQSALTKRPDDWFLALQASPDGSKLLVRTQSGQDRGFTVFGSMGQELWVDSGRAPDGARGPDRAQ